MYTIYLLAIIPFCFVLYQCLKEMKEWGFEWDTFWMFIPFSIGGAIIGFVIAILLPCSYNTYSFSVPIESLKDNSSVSGSFFLGCGNINGSMKYVYYCKEDSNTYKMWQAEYWQAAVRYTNTQPQVHITITDKDKNSLWNKFAIDIDEKYEWSCIFDVPKGSIKNNYELDSQ